VKDWHLAGGGGGGPACIVNEPGHSARSTAAVRREHAQDIRLDITSKMRQFPSRCPPASASVRVTRPYLRAASALTHISSSPFCLRDRPP